MRLARAHRALGALLVVALIGVSFPGASAKSPDLALSPTGVPAVDLRSVFFLDASTGFAAGSNGVIAKTTNGGENWVQVRGGTEDLRGVAFWSASQGVAVSFDRKALGTTDGGQTWTLLNGNVTPEPYLEYINVDRLALPPGPTNFVGLFVGGYNPFGGLPYVPEQAWRTEGNGGAYWGSQPVLRPCRYPDPEGETGGDPVGKGEFFGADFVDASRGWVVGADYFPAVTTATVYATTNGGVSWYQQSVGAPVALRDVSFATTTTGVAVSAQGRVFYTSNGGSTWSEGSSPVTSTLNAVEMIDASVGWAVGAGGVILKTTNGGQTWTQVASPTANDLYDLTAFGSRAWAVGRYGTIVLTEDGATWRRPQPDVTPPVVTSLTSPTHPSETAWYANASPSFSWSATDPAGVVGYSYALDRSPDTVPPAAVATTSVSAAFSGLSSGEWWFHLRAVDGYGNWSPPSHLKVRIDVTSPVTLDDAASLYPGDATITLAPSDAHAGVALTRWTLDGTPGTGTTVSASADGTHTLSYASVDAVGNAEATKTVQFVIDRVLPAVVGLESSTHPVAASWYTATAASFSWEASSNVGVAGYSYELSADPACVPDEVVDTSSPSASVSVPGEGVWYFCVRAEDVLGRWGGTQRRTVRVDLTPPATTDDHSAVCTATPCAVNLHAADALSGVSVTRWVLDGVPGTGSTVVASADGTHTLAYASVDFAGNVETTKTVQFLIDATPPSLTVSSPSHPSEAVWYRLDDAVLSWNAADANGVAGYSYALDQIPGTVPDTSVDATATSIAFSDLPTGEHWFHVRAVDAYGTWSAPQHRKIRVDVDPPATWANVNALYEGSAAIVLSPDDGSGSGVASTWWSLNGGTRVYGTAVNVTTLGAYELAYGSMDVAGNVEGTRTALFEVVRPTGSTPTSVPVQGATRIATAIEASKLAFPQGAPAVVIATARNWPDALGGSALAGAAGGPVLLTEPTALPAEVAAEVARLGASKAYIVGGTGAVSSAVATALAGVVGQGNVVRVSGPDRYATARAVAAQAVALQGAAYDGTAFLATGANFPDALGAGPLAAAKGRPIYLVDPKTGADAVLISAMKAAGVTHAVALGGGSVVSTSAVNAVAAGVPCSTERWWGADRYVTAAAVAQKSAEAGLSWNGVGIATGENFPDALSAGASLGRLGSVLLLTRTASLPDPTRTALAENKRFISKVRFFGGTGAVSQMVRNAVLRAIK